MSAEQIDQPSQKVESAQETPQIPDYLASPNAVFGDKGVQWRYGRAPDYTKTRKVWAEGKWALCCCAGLVVAMPVDRLVHNVSSIMHAAQPLHVAT